jgi:hypothetical protein
LRRTRAFSREDTSTCTFPAVSLQLEFDTANAMNKQSSQQRDVMQLAIITVAICFTSPMAFAAVYLLVALEGDTDRLRANVAVIPWTHPLVAPLLLAALCLTAFAVALSRGQIPIPALNHASFGARRTRHLLTCAMFEAPALLGLVLGMLLGPDVAPLTLVLFLIPPIGGVLIFPREEQWRESTL